MDDGQTLRVYGGVQGDRRKAERRAQFIEAGLDVLGAPGSGQLTVRGACQRAGVVARYFYESFADRDDLAGAVYDHVVTEIASTTAEVVDAAGDDPVARTRAGVANIVRLIDADPRKGRVLFEASMSDALIARRRQVAARLFARLLGERAPDTYGPAGSAQHALTSQFVVGGFAQALNAWLSREVSVSREELIDHCTDLFLRVADARRSAIT
ncbi:TetR/AcrR family transcriptional regulator [Pseudonocardia spinosispora]|uniref:TetR/AcrR family transcriptional regulator n=1 Tax=Pseudonocardia spinosispora TaxID=103441 RepID=UPI0003FAB1EB|nr:TetR/AcrR family transcriptional regulator [Pseudonocardia spinosispora]